MAGGDPYIYIGAREEDHSPVFFFFFFFSFLSYILYIITC